MNHLWNDEMKNKDFSTIFGDKKIDAIYLALGRYGFIIMGIFCLLLFFLIYPLGLLLIFSFLFFIVSLPFFLINKKIKSFNK